MIWVVSSKALRDQQRHKMSIIVPQEVSSLREPGIILLRLVQNKVAAFAARRLLNSNPSIGVFYSANTSEDGPTGATESRMPASRQRIVGVRGNAEEQEATRVRARARERRKYQIELIRLAITMSKLLMS
jgi:hypothetical protein